MINASPAVNKRIKPWPQKAKNLCLSFFAQGRLLFKQTKIHKNAKPIKIDLAPNFFGQA